MRKILFLGALAVLLSLGLVLASCGDGGSGGGGGGGGGDIAVAIVASQVDAVHPMGLAFGVVVVPIQQVEEAHAIANVIG